MAFKIKDLNYTDGTVRIDWGFSTTNHPIPQTILDNPDMDYDQIRDELSKLRPAPPQLSVATQKLKNLVEVGLPLDSAQPVVYSEGEQDAVINKKEY